VAKAVSLAASLLVVFIGVLGLTGWALDIAAFKSVMPNLVAMKLNTSAGLILSGIGLALVAWREPGRMVRFLILIIVAVVTAIGAVTLCEYVFGWNLGVDEWLFHEIPNAIETAEPGRMAPVSAFCLMVMGAGLLAASQSILERLREPILAGLGTALAVIGGLSTAGCLAQVWFHAPSWNNSGMAIHTAAAFLLLGCGLLALTMRRRALKWSLNPLITAGFVVAILVMLLGAGVSFRFTSQLSETARLVTHRQEVLKEIGDASAGMATIESAQRGYVILGDEALLAPLDQAKARVHATLADLRKLTADNSSQQRRLDQLDHQVLDRLAFSDATILTRRQQGFAAAQQMIASGQGIRLTATINGLFREMQDAEYALLEQDQERSRAASTSTFLLLPLGVFLSLTISSLGLFFLNTGVTERRRMEKAWRGSEERFQTVILHLAEGLVICGLDGELLHWNPAALAIHGFSGNQNEGHWLAEVGRIFELSTLDGMVVPLEHWPMSRVIRGEHLSDVSMRVRRLDKEWKRVFSYSGSIIREPSGADLAFLTMFDITERTHSEEALRVSERQLGSFVEQAPVSMAMLDRHMVYLSTSRRWVDDFGRGHSALVGLNHYDIHPDMPEKWKEIHRQGLAGVPSKCDEELWVHHDGTRHWMRWAVQPWQDSHGEIGGIMILTEDITHRKEAEQIQFENVRLEAENRRFAEASRLKSEFLANMSHELRTPLNGIIGFTELLSDEKPGPVNLKQKEYLGDVLNSARHLHQLINDVLDLAKVEAGKFDFQPQPFILAEAIQEVCAVVSGLANKKQLRLKIDTSPELASVTLDEHRFKQICYNLLSNAVKFTDPTGSVEIATRPRDGASFEVRVTDTGIGIKPADMERLFREFEQLDSGASRRFEGTGLGLALTRKLAEMQGGSISVASEYGKGSTFTVILPREAKATIA
jgi:PAS domain S-box-containing protein